MLRYYQNQTATLKSLSSYDERGNPTYISTPIKCRFLSTEKTVRNREGILVKSEAVCYTSSSVNYDDVIVFGGQDWPIIKIGKMPGLSGNVKFYEVRL